MGIADGLVAWGLTTLVGAFSGSFLAGYLKKKGENLATKEDIDGLTERTKEIEAKIDNQVWDRQRQWELKRDTLLETVQSIAAFKSANLAVIAAAKKDRNIKQPESTYWAVKKTEVTDEWEKAHVRFERARLMTALLGDEEINDALVNLGVAIRQSSKAILQRAPEERYYEAMNRLNDYDHKCIAAIRSSLGLPDGDWKNYASIQ